MKLLYKKEHTTCMYYDKGADLQIEVEKIHKGQPFDRRSHQCKIVVVLEGSATYKLRGLVMTELQEGQILLIAPDKHFSISTKKAAKLLVIRLTQIAGLCECFPLESLLQHRDENHKEITLLEANPAIDIFIAGLTTSLEQGLRCRYYLETKTKELFYLLRGFYTKEQLAQFFNEMLHVDAHFYYFIKQNYQNINSIPDFAKVLDMKQLAFEKKFKEIFGIPPYKWIIEQKSKDIYHALCTENTPLKELTERFGFSSKSSFSDFCKKNLGAPPGRIRENILVSDGNDE